MKTTNKVRELLSRANLDINSPNHDSPEWRTLDRLHDAILALTEVVEEEKLKANFSRFSGGMP